MVSPTTTTTTDDGSDSDDDDDTVVEPNWDLLKESLGPEALAALQNHYEEDYAAVASISNATTTTSAAAAAAAAATELSSTTIIELPEHNTDYSKKYYWDDRFAKEEQFNWLVSYEDVKDQIAPFLSPDSKILLVGCGNSTFSEQLYDAGFRQLWNVDYSKVVIDKMTKKYEETRPEMKWLVRILCHHLFCCCTGVEWIHKIESRNK